VNPKKRDPEPPTATIIGPSAGTGGEYDYLIPDEPSHEWTGRDEEPGRYDITIPGTVGTRPPPIVEIEP